ncbi:sigma-70 family RNA polymerase sigma factor [Actinoplanes aureus]|uniref:Sigma-70 family RNA polymerase sigma factor n=1 Tax=Actinoplanes aureus TaxID=2792083 RepID=A0A931FVK7_9ACTN|nr:sigma-70 family RNA polymerase sigma factor [Actinoplanes aureus]MBG0560355.1 sigma-70 family RNA polymerase sigma factor [Actinoplanes aureus]
MADEVLAERFQANRPRLRAVAYRMLGSLSEADDAVQEAWLRLSRSDPDSVDNLAAWLTTVVGRICLDMLRSRVARREEPEAPEAVAAGPGPEGEALLADSVGLALLVVLETLTPTERLAFVLHDMFAVSFEDIAVVVGRSPAAARQLASRARRRVRGGAPSDPAGVGPEAVRKQAIVSAFLAASRGGDMAALLTMLDPDVVVRGDETAARMADRGETRGAEVVARFFAGRAQGALPAYIDDLPGAVVIVGGTTRLTLTFTIAGDRITGIDTVADPDELARMDVVLAAA